MSLAGLCGGEPAAHLPLPEHWLALDTPEGQAGFTDVEGSGAQALTVSYFQVSSLYCAGGSGLIEVALKRLPGVVCAEVNGLIECPGLMQHRLFEVCGPAAWRSASCLATTRAGYGSESAGGYAPCAAGGRGCSAEGFVMDILFSQRSVWGAATAGGLWVASPCGLLHSRLLVASIAPRPLEGTTVMPAFAPGSGGPRWLGSCLPAPSAADKGDRRARCTTRLPGALLTASATWSLINSVQSTTGFC